MNNLYIRVSPIFLTHNLTPLKTNLYVALKSTRLTLVLIIAEFHPNLNSTYAYTLADKSVSKLESLSIQTRN